MESLTAKQAQKVTWVLSLVDELPSIPSKYFKKLINTNDIWEIRINYGGKIFRLLGFFDGPQLIILNHAFHKKTQKTPRQAIQITETRKRDYFNDRRPK